MFSRYTMREEKAWTKSREKGADIAVCLCLGQEEGGKVGNEAGQKP